MLAIVYFNEIHKITRKLHIKLTLTHVGWIKTIKCMKNKGELI